MRTGFAHLPLHSGKAPRWLFNKMVRLAREIVCHITAEYGASEVLSDCQTPFGSKPLVVFWDSIGTQAA